MFFSRFRLIFCFLFLGCPLLDQQTTKHQAFKISVFWRAFLWLAAIYTLFDGVTYALPDPEFITTATTGVSSETELEDSTNKTPDNDVTRPRQFPWSTDERRRRMLLPHKEEKVVDVAVAGREESPNQCDVMFPRLHRTADGKNTQGVFMQVCEGTGITAAGVGEGGGGRDCALREYAFHVSFFCFLVFFCHLELRFPCKNRP